MKSVLTRTAEVMTRTVDAHSDSDHAAERDAQAERVLVRAARQKGPRVERRTRQANATAHRRRATDQ